MIDKQLSELVREMFSDVDWQKDWAEQISGRRLHRYVVAIDPTYDEWHEGEYVATLFYRDRPVYDVLFYRGQLLAFEIV